MNKNTLIGSILIAGIMLWWMTTSTSNAEAQAAAQAKARAAAAAEAAKSDSADELVLPAQTGTPEMKAAPVLGAAPALNTAAGDSAGVADTSAVADSAKADTVAAPAITPRTVTVETDKFIMTLTNKGGKVQSVIVKALPDSAGHFPELIQDTTLGALDLKLGKADLSEALFDVNGAPEWITVDTDTTVSFTFKDANGNQVVRNYHFTKEGVAVHRYRPLC